VSAGLGPDDLVIDSGMLQSAGFRRRVAAAAAAGFTGMSMWGRDRSAAHADGLSDADIRRVLADHGMAVADLNACTDWLPGTADVGGGPFGSQHPFFGWSERDFFETADAVGARSLGLTDVAGLHVSVEQAAEAFAGVCDRAADHGLLVHIESMPMSSLRTIGDAWAVVEAADRRNGGLLVDSRHFFRAGPLDALDDIPAERVLAVQVSDAPAVARPDPWQDSASRFMPGEGELPLRQLLGTLRDRGCVAPIGLEVFGRDTENRPVEDIARHGHAALVSVLP
jgi:sugar phosphate isomerase/epimerase